jgi:enoyl-CoA hydratase/carnithine racemase
VSLPSRPYAKIRVATSASGEVATITLSVPERRNAIGPQMMNELLWALTDIEPDPLVRVVILTGDGKAFCAGGDFAAMHGGEASELPTKGDYADLLLGMMTFEKPIVARVNGHAMGGGLGLVAASTFAVACEGAQLGTPEVDVGLFPMMIMAVLKKHVPRRRLLEMMLLGERMPAAEAAKLGLVNKVVTPDALDATVGGLVSRLLEKSPMALRLGLRAFAEQDDLDLDHALPLLRGKLGECLATDDAREGLMAFLEKRRPVWTGK